MAPNSSTVTCSTSTSHTGGGGGGGGGVGGAGLCVQERHHHATPSATGPTIASAWHVRPDVGEPTAATANLLLPSTHRTKTHEQHQLLRRIGRNKRAKHLPGDWGQIVQRVSPRQHFQSGVQGCGRERPIQPACSHPVLKHGHSGGGVVNGHCDRIAWLAGGDLLRSGGCVSRIPWQLQHRKP